jgi:oxalate decarboxylase/phosphoglucose isomerase-like protein (cupin superfamily)
MDNSELLGLSVEEKGKGYSVRVDGLGESALQNAGWERPLSKLVDDAVIFDQDAGRQFIEAEGDVNVYDVIHLWQLVPGIAEISERSKVYCDITVLNYGIISTTGFGELFLTYGHDHTRRFGEIYSILAGEGNLVMYLPGSNRTRVIRMREGDEHYIPPGWVHRFYCGRRGTVLAGFVSHEAGHRYETVKGRGFPYHLFLDEKKGEVSYLRNERFGDAKLEILDAVKRPSWVPKYFGAVMEMRRQLEKEV